MTDTVTLKGITFTVERWGESDLYYLTCPHCHPGVDFKKDEVLEVEGERYIVYLVGERSINLQRLHPPERFKPLTVGHVDHGRTSLSVALMYPPEPCSQTTEAQLRAQLAEAKAENERLQAEVWRLEVGIEHLHVATGNLLEGGTAELGEANEQTGK